MELSVRDTIELVGMVVLPVVTLVGTVVVRTLHSNIKALGDGNVKLSERIEAVQRDNSLWLREIPERYARRDELERMFEQLNAGILRLDEKLERVLHRSE